MLVKGIKQKLVLSLIITTLVIMSVFFLILDRYLRDFSLKEAEKTFALLGKNTSSMIQRPLFNSDYLQLRNIVKPIILEDFDYLVIFDSVTQNIAFVEDKRDLGDLLNRFDTFKDKTSNETQHLIFKGQPYTQYIFPVIAPGLSKPLGFLVIGVSEDKMKSRLKGITDRILIISILLFFTLTTTIYFLSNRIVKPIKELSTKIGHFASGDYSVRSEIKTHDEIRDLSDNFNIMANKINEQILSIEQYSKNLELMVQERTNDLLNALDSIRDKDTKLTQAEKINSLNSIVSAIAHEINNPLAIISGNLQLIEARLDEPILQKKLNIANEGVERIAKLIDEINFFSAIKDITTAPLHISKTINDAIQKIIPISIRTEIESTKDDCITSNAYLLSVSIENILRNSVEIIQHRHITNGRITIRYFRDIPYFIVEISDNGGGFADLKKAFEPFYTTYDLKKGLGLTFVLHAIQALNGEIKCENIESGARITIMLPVEIPEEGIPDQCLP